MPRCVGTAREVAEAAAAINRLLMVVAAAVVAPPVLQIILPFALAANERWKGLRMRESQSWTVHLSLLEVNLAREAAFPNVFYVTFGCSQAHFEEIFSALRMPAVKDALQEEMQWVDSLACRHGATQVVSLLG